MQNKAMRKKKIKLRHANKQKEREAAGDRSRCEGTWLMGHAAQSQAQCMEGKSPCKAVRRGSCASPQELLLSNLTCKLASTASCTMIHGHDPQFKQEVGRGVGRNLPRPPQYPQWCTVTMDLCYLGESVTRDNFYLISPRATTLKQNAALSLPLLRCLIWQLLSFT